MNDYNSFAFVYDKLNTALDNAPRFKLIEQYADKSLPILDAGCGTGDLSLYLAKKKYNVIAVDLSEDMLAVAHNKCENELKRVLFLHQDLRHLDLYGTIGTAVCIQDTLNHMPDESAVEETFKRIALFLESGGVFIFDMNTEYKHKSILADNSLVLENDDVFCVWQNSLNDDLSVDIELDVFSESERDDLWQRNSYSFTERLYSQELIMKKLADCDFTIENVLDGEELTDLTPTSQRILYIARKN